jgi:hypothetical protein
MTQNEACEVLAAPPTEKHRTGHRITRTAKVKLAWNEQCQEWEWMAPEGVSHYIEQIKPNPPKPMTGS